MDEDVTKLTDEELDKRINGEEEEPSTDQPSEEPTETPEEPQEEPKEDAPEQSEPSKEEPEEPAKEESPTEEPKPPSRRETLRIQQILAKREKATDKDEPQTQPTRREALDYQQALDADPEVIKQLETDRQAEGQARYNDGLEQARRLSEERAIASEFRTNIKLDYPLVKDKLAKLDEADVRALDEEYLQITGYDTQTGLVQNPNIGYAEYIEARYEQAQRLAASMTAETTKNIAKQAAQTGLRPDGSSAKRLNLNQAPENMTDEELDAIIGQAIPKK